MSELNSSIAPEQIRAFVTLVHHGSFRAAADALHFTRENLRRKLTGLEQRLNVKLYEKGRGKHANIRLTREGNLFYAKSAQFLHEAKTLTRLFDSGKASAESKIAVSDYIANHHLGYILKGFHKQFPDIAIQVTSGTEQQTVSAMQTDPSIKLGICVSDDFPEDLIRRRLFSMTWCFTAELGHPLLQQTAVSLRQVANEALITFQPGCPAQKRILEAFHQKAITPRINFEVTTTQMILNLVEVGAGVAIIPISQPFTMFRGRRVGQIPISDAMPPIEFSILTRKDLLEDAVAPRLLDRITDQFSYQRLE